jgi:hypothetical protein
MFNFNINSQKKSFHVSASGSFGVEEAKQIVEEYKNKAKGLNLKEYVLIIDSEAVSVSTPDVVPYMNELIQLYTDAPFKKKYFVSPKSVIASMQVKRVSQQDKKSENTFMDLVTLVSSADEVLDKL